MSSSSAGEQQGGSDEEAALLQHVLATTTELSAQDSQMLEDVLTKRRALEGLHRNVTPPSPPTSTGTAIVPKPKQAKRSVSSDTMRSPRQAPPMRRAQTATFNRAHKASPSHQKKETTIPEGFSSEFLMDIVAERASSSTTVDPFASHADTAMAISADEMMRNEKMAAFSGMEPDKKQASTTTNMPKPKAKRSVSSDTTRSPRQAPPIRRVHTDAQNKNYTSSRQRNKEKETAFSESTSSELLMDIVAERASSSSSTTVDPFQTTQANTTTSTAATSADEVMMKNEKMAAFSGMGPDKKMGGGRRSDAEKASTTFVPQPKQAKRSVSSDMMRSPWQAPPMRRVQTDTQNNYHKARKVNQEKETAISEATSSELLMDIVAERASSSTTVGPFQTWADTTMAMSAEEIMIKKEKNATMYGDEQTMTEDEETALTMTSLRSQTTSSEPGAYMGAPGEDLQRTHRIRFSLLGVSSHHDAPSLSASSSNHQNNANHNSAMPMGPNSCMQNPKQNENHDNDPSFAHDADEPQNLTEPVNNNNDEELAVASPVMEDEEEEEQMRPSAAPVDLHQVQKREENRQRQTLYFVAFMILACLATAIVVGVVVATQKDKEPEVIVLPATATPTVYYSMEPSEVPSSAPTGSLDFLLENLPIDTLERLTVYGTPQWKAYDWLSHHQNITNLPEWRKQQLFALGTFYYSFEGDNWFQPIRERWMDDVTDECFWYSSGFSYFENDKVLEYDIGVPPCNNLGQFTNLQLDDLQLASLAPVIPPELALLSNLSGIQLGWNNIAGNISAVLPPSIYTMTALTALSLEGNYITGKIPTEMGQLDGLVFLRLDQNQITGGIPSELGQLTGLFGLGLQFNLLNGQIPSELGRLTSLFDLFLASNQLTGETPTELGYLTPLKTLALSSNSLTGQIATELGLLDSLTWLFLDSNLFTGQLFTGLGFLSSLNSLYLAHNSLTGQIPSEIGHLSALGMFYSDGNQFTGHISSEFGRMSSLWFFSACCGHLTGHLPTELGRLPLTQLWLEFNALSGRVPAEIWSQSSLERIYLAGNSFSGSLPSEIGLLSSMQELVLFGNLLNGTIPSNIGSMLSLQKLFLHDNNLTGTLPQELAGSMGLRLDGNQFSGAVPGHLCPILWCDCSANVTLVSTCADLIHFPGVWPGRFPPSSTGEYLETVVLNIVPDGFPWETAWVWQQGSPVMTETSSAPLQVPAALYSFVLPLAPNTTHRLLVSDSFGNGLVDFGWITLTAGNQEVLYSFLYDQGKFSGITVDVTVGPDGMVKELTSNIECDPAFQFC